MSKARTRVGSIGGFARQTFERFVLQRSRTQLVSNLVNPRSVNKSINRQATVNPDNDDRPAHCFSFPSFPIKFLLFSCLLSRIKRILLFIHTRTFPVPLADVLI